MKKKELELLDSFIDVLTTAIEILKKNRGFYIYYNEPTKNINVLLLKLESFNIWSRIKNIKRLAEKPISITYLAGYRIESNPGIDSNKNL